MPTTKTTIWRAMCHEHGGEKRWPAHAGDACSVSILPCGCLRQCARYEVTEERGWLARVTSAVLGTEYVVNGYLNRRKPVALHASRAEAMRCCAHLGTGWRRRPLRVARRTLRRVG